MASSGPSPVIPLLLVATLGCVIYWEILLTWYEYLLVLQELLQESAAFVVFAAAIVLILVANFITNELIVIPLGFLLVLFLFWNLVAATLVLLLVVHFLGIYYYSPEKSAPSWETAQSTGGESSGFGLGCYILALLCIVLCAMFTEGEGCVWISLVVVLACVLFFNIF